MVFYAQQPGAMVKKVRLSEVFRWSGGDSLHRFFGCQHVLSGFVVFGSLVLALVCFSCSDRFENVDRYFTTADFTQRSTLHGSRLELGTLLAPANIFVHDSLFFVAGIALRNNVSVFKRGKTYTKVGEIIPTGQGPDEMQSVVKMSFDKGEIFWARDLVSGSLKQFALYVRDDSVFTERLRSIFLPMPGFNVFFLQDHRIGVTTPDIQPLKRFYVYDTTGTRLGEFGDYPVLKREIPPTAMVEVYNGWVGVHPDKQKFALCYEFTDLVEFYDSGFNLLTRVHGPHQFFPEFDLKDRGGAPVMVRRYNKTKFAYQHIECTDRFVYMLYDNGETVSKETSHVDDHYSTLVVLDWQGNPCALYQLDHPIITFCVDEQRGILFGLDRNESEVYTFPFYLPPSTAAEVAQ